MSAAGAETELAAALVLTRKRRIGPYRLADDPDAGVRIKEMGVLARAGFSRDVAKQALDVSREDADNRIFELRREGPSRQGLNPAPNAGLAKSRFPA